LARRADEQDILISACVIALGLLPCAAACDAASAALWLPHAAQDPVRRAADENAARVGDCSRYPAWEESPYVRPWEPGAEFLVTRTTGHFIRGNGGVGLYAIDVPMPIGTTIVAARAGRVVAVLDEFLDGNGEDLKENTRRWRSWSSTAPRLRNRCTTRIRNHKPTCPHPTLQPPAEVSLQ